MLCSLKVLRALTPRKMAPTPITSPRPGQKKLTSARMSELFPRSFALSIFWAAKTSVGSVRRRCERALAGIGASSENNVPTCAPQCGQLASPGSSPNPHSAQTLLKEDIRIEPRCSVGSALLVAHLRNRFKQREL